MARQRRGKADDMRRGDAIYLDVAWAWSTEHNRPTPSHCRSFNCEVVLGTGAPGLGLR
jgi:hypothetical protein